MGQGPMALRRVRSNFPGRPSGAWGDDLCPGRAGRHHCTHSAALSGVAVFAPSTPPAPNADLVSRALRILIVEDHEDLADALRANLRSEGYQASVASDGRQALALVRADPPDII